MSPYALARNTRQTVLGTKEKNVIHTQVRGAQENNVSFANVVSSQNSTMKQAVKIKEMRNSVVVAGARVTIPLEAVQEVSSRFANTLYGYFIGKRLAFPLVENYVKNTWAKFGLKRVMLDGDFFMFQFDTKEGMEKVLESGS
nr:zinc knuckle CX2CX4HX4C [Tanacetum cinerariifolium]